MKINLWAIKWENQSLICDAAILIAPVIRRFINGSRDGGVTGAYGMPVLINWEDGPKKNGGSFRLVPSEKNCGSLSGNGQMSGCKRFFIKSHGDIVAELLPWIRHLRNGLYIDDFNE